MLRITSLLAGFGLLLLLGCKQTDEATIAPAVPTSMVGNWKVSAFTFNPAWRVLVNGSPERFTDYVTYLKRINETCLTDVVWTFTKSGGLSTNLGSVPCEDKGGNSRLIIDSFVEPNASYVETSNVLNIRGTGNQTGMDFTKTFGPGNTVNLQWKDTHDMSNELVETVYTFTLTKQ